MSSDVSLAALSPCSIHDPSSQAAEISSISSLPSLVSSHVAGLITYHLAVPAIDRQTPPSKPLPPVVLPWSS